METTVHQEGIASGRALNMSLTDGLVYMFIDVIRR